jgi:hypothetical protein
VLVSEVEVDNPIAPAHFDAAGEYDVLFCTMPCDPQNAVVRIAKFNDLVAAPQISIEPEDQVPNVPLDEIVRIRVSGLVCLGSGSTKQQAVWPLCRRQDPDLAGS